MDELLTADALEQARLVRDRSVSSAELTQFYLDRIENVDPEVNAFVTVAADSALCLAGEKDDGRGDELPPFHGIPIGIKDLDDTAGLRTTYSHVGFRDFVPDESTVVVRRLEAAGFVVLGKTNVPEFGAAVSTESQLNGVCRNPHGLDRSVGGSSGGAAAAVAAGLVPVAQASDGAGSIRLPAACCGLVGLKPSRGRITLAPGPGTVLEGCSTQGVVTSSVRDTAALLDVLTGSEIGDTFHVDPPERPFLLEVEFEADHLRIATTLESPSGEPVDDECASAVNTVAKVLAELGHDVREDRPRWADESLVGHYRTFYSTLFAYNRAFDPAVLESHNREFLAYAESQTSLDYVKTFVHLQQWVRQTLRLWEDYDLLLTPTLCKPPILLGAGPAPEDPGDLPWWGFSNYIAFLPVANLTGQPAISLPAYRSTDGLPIGIQLIGRIGDEALLLRVASTLEREMSWEWRPPVVAVDARTDGVVDVT